MKILHVWLDVDSDGQVVMAATSRFPGRSPLDYAFRIYPANAPSAIRFYEAFKAGEELRDEDAQEVIKASKHEHATGEWKITGMKIEPNDAGRDVLKVTLKSKGLQASGELWPPRTPSARLFLKSFKKGREFYERDLRYLVRFIRAEMDMVGLSPGEDLGILDWNPDWDEYL